MQRIEKKKKRRTKRGESLGLTPEGWVDIQKT